MTLLHVPTERDLVRWLVFWLAQLLRETTETFSVGALHRDREM